MVEEAQNIIEIISSGDSLQEDSLKNLIQTEINNPEEEPQIFKLESLNATICIPSELEGQTEIQQMETVDFPIKITSAKKRKRAPSVNSSRVLRPKKETDFEIPKEVFQITIKRKPARAKSSVKKKITTEKPKTPKQAKKAAIKKKKTTKKVTAKASATSPPAKKRKTVSSAVSKKKVVQKRKTPLRKKTVKKPTKKTGKQVAAKRAKSKSK